MHYANGQAAKIGDLVRGKGYNIKHEIIGLLVSAYPEGTACNAQVATVTNTSTVLVDFFKWNQHEASQPVIDTSNERHSQQPTRSFKVMATIEYGQLDAFVAIDPLTGEVLPPE